MVLDRAYIKKIITTTAKLTELACTSMARRRCGALEGDDSFELNNSVMGDVTEQEDSFDVYLSESYGEDSTSTRSGTSTHSGFGRRPVVVKGKSNGYRVVR